MYNLQQCVFILQDLFIAGSETTSASLAAAILYMVLYPDVQIKVQAEIDQHVGKVSASRGFHLII